MNRGARGVISLYYSPLEVEVSWNRFDQNKRTTKDTKYRSCLITCMSQAVYPLYRIRMGPKELSSYPQNKRDKNPYPSGTTMFIRHHLLNIYINSNNRARIIVSHHLIIIPNPLLNYDHYSPEFFLYLSLIQFSQSQPMYFLALSS